MSLRARLVLGLLVSLLVGVAIVDIVTYTLVTRSQLDQVDRELERAHQPIERAVSESSRSQNDAIRDVALGFYVEVRSSDGDQEVQIPLRRPGEEPTTITGQVPTPDDDLTDDEAVFASVASSGGHPLRVRVARQPDDRVLIIGQTLEQIDETNERLLAVLVAATVGALIAAGAAGLWMVRVGLRPLIAVERTAGEIDDTDIDRRVPGEDERTEVGRLAVAINRMLSRLQAAFEQSSDDMATLRESESRMRQFVADASHELRTPIAATAAYAELYERGARDRPADLDRAITGIRAETARMAALVEDLLLLAQLEEGRPLVHQDIDVTDVVIEAVDANQLLAPDRPVSLRIDAAPIVTGDVARLRQVLDNVLGNVRTHTPPGTRCEVAVTADGDDAVITVTDDGPGMLEDDARRAFDRFHRADGSRSRASGGAGLGLAIVAAIVAAHDGSVTVDSSPGGGTTIVIRLPREHTLGVETESDASP